MGGVSFFLIWKHQVPSCNTYNRIMFLSLPAESIQSFFPKMMMPWLFCFFWLDVALGMQDVFGFCVRPPPPTRSLTHLGGGGGGEGGKGREGRRSWLMHKDRVGTALERERERREGKGLLLSQRLQTFFGPRPTLPLVEEHTNCFQPLLS